MRRARGDRRFSDLTEEQLQLTGLAILAAKLDAGLEPPLLGRSTSGATALEAWLPRLSSAYHEAVHAPGRVFVVPGDLPLHPTLPSHDASMRHRDATMERLLRCRATWRRPASSERANCRTW